MIYIIKMFYWYHIFFKCHIVKRGWWIFNVVPLFRLFLFPCLSVTADIMDLWNVNNTIWDQHTVLASGAGPAGGTDAFCFSIHSNTLTAVPTATITNHWQTQTTHPHEVKSCVAKLKNDFALIFDLVYSFFLVFNLQTASINIREINSQLPLWQYFPPNPEGHLHFPGRRHSPPFLHFG